jgi:hypothetical protein
MLKTLAGTVLVLSLAAVQPAVAQNAAAAQTTAGGQQQENRKECANSAPSEGDPDAPQNYVEYGGGG